MNIRIVVICLILALCGCKKNASKTVYYFKYKVDGTAVEVSTDGSSPMAYTDSRGGLMPKQLKFSSSTSNGSHVLITLQDAATMNSGYTGSTYQLTAIDTCGGNARLFYNGNSKSYETNCSSTSSMQLQYDEGKKEIRGTFSAYVPALDTSKGIKGVNITEGELFLRWERR